MKKMINFKSLGLIAILSINSLVSAQGDANFRQNQLNVLQLNPAQAGAGVHSEIICYASNQWVNMPGAPKTYLTSANFNVLRNFGIGATVMGDQYGPVNMSKGEINLAYHLKLSDKWRLGVGMKMGVTYTNVNLGELTIIDPNDPYMNGVLRSGINWNAGFGGLLYSKRFYLGYAMPNVSKTSFLNHDMTMFVDTKFGHIAYAGGTLPLGTSVDFRPNVVYRQIKGTPLNLEANSIFTFNKTYDFGVSYQYKSSVGAIAGMQIKEYLYLGYAYSYPINELNRVTMQSHEVALRYRFLNKSERATNPRYFL
jgi:type IX secretion system PorP/SprF family membrane protein